MIHDLEEGQLNKFEFINYISKVSRKLHDECHGVILESKCLEWALSGNRPQDIDDRLDMKKRRDDERWNPDNYVVVDDDQIRKAVKSSIAISRQNKHLIYCYEGLDEYQSSRVRVVCNIVWDKIIKNSEEY